METTEINYVVGNWYIEVLRSDGDFSQVPPMAKKRYSHISVKLTGSRGERVLDVAYPPEEEYSRFSIPRKVISELERYHEAWELVTKKK